MSVKISRRGWEEARTSHEYSVTAKAFGHTYVAKVRAGSYAEAIRKVRQECGISVEAQVIR
jgi:hypothetical protein